MFDRKLHDEEGRIAALQRYGVLDTAPEEPFEKITSLVQAVMGVPICAVSLIDRERQWFKSIQGLQATETPRSVSFCTHTIQPDQPMIVADAREDVRFKNNPFVVAAPHVGSYAGVPLRTPDGYNVGALCAIDTVPREFTDAQIEILKSFASLVVDELELRRIAERDHLTGALTRRGFINQINKEMERFRRHQRESVLVLLDIDHFKSINDRYGHPAGDAVLKAVSAACMQQLRVNDSFGRLGGEEFGILLSEANLSQGYLAAEKVRQAIEELQVPILGGARVTASFGLAGIPSSRQTAEDWIAQADEALYSAKRLGRNRCFTHSGSLAVTAA